MSSFVLIFLGNKLVLRIGNDVIVVNAWILGLFFIILLNTLVYTVELLGKN